MNNNTAKINTVVERSDENIIDGNVMDDRIIKFIRKHHLLTLATSENNIPWCASAFYAFDKGHNRLIISSKNQTKHATQASQNQYVACSIALETKIIGKLQGIQISGTIQQSESPADKATYLKKFPYAAPFLEPLWAIQITHAKFTDNTLGFGKKLTFNATE